MERKKRPVHQYKNRLCLVTYPTDEYLVGFAKKADRYIQTTRGGYSRLTIIRQRGRVISDINYGLENIYPELHPAIQEMTTATLGEVARAHYVGAKSQLTEEELSLIGVAFNSDPQERSSLLQRLFRKAEKLSSKDLIKRKAFGEDKFITILCASKLTNDAYDRLFTRPQELQKGTLFYWEEELEGALKSIRRKVNE